MIRRQRLVRAEANMSCSSVKCSSNGKMKFQEEGNETNTNTDKSSNRLAIARALTFDWGEHITLSASYCECVRYKWGMKRN